MAEVELVNSPEKDLKARSIALVALTFYPIWYEGDLKSIGDTDKVRGDLALQSIRGSLYRGYRIVVADGGSSDAFQKEVREQPSAVFFRRHGQKRGEGRREGFSIASELVGVKAILRAESEKKSIYEEFADQICEPILRGEADVVVGKRNPVLHRSTYPEYQVISEIDANNRFNHLLHKADLLPKDQSLDMFFGVVAFINTPEVRKLFMEKYDFTLPTTTGIRKYVDPENWSDGYFFSIVKALSQGFRVVSVEVDFRYPEIQRRNEETINKGAIYRFIAKRAEQKWGLLDELIHFIRYLHRDPKSGLKKVDQ